LPKGNSHNQSNFTNFFYQLPGYLISILHEWIDKPILLCTFDMAICNRLLRDRYLIWLHDKITRGTLKTLSLTSTLKQFLYMTNLVCHITWCLLWLVQEKTKTNNSKISFLLFWTDHWTREMWNLSGKYQRKHPKWWNKWNS